VVAWSAATNILSATVTPYLDKPPAQSLALPPAWKKIPGTNQPLPAEVSPLLLLNLASVCPQAACVEAALHGSKVHSPAA
jgi:hypothetical protein